MVEPDCRESGTVKEWWTVPTLQLLYRLMVRHVPVVEFHCVQPNLRIIAEQSGVFPLLGIDCC